MFALGEPNKLADILGATYTLGDVTYLPLPRF